MYSLYSLSQVIDEILFRLNIVYGGMVLNHTLYKPYTGSLVVIEAGAAAAMLSRRAEALLRQAETVEELLSIDAMQTQKCLGVRSAHDTKGSRHHLAARFDQFRNWSNQGRELVKSGP